MLILWYHFIFLLNMLILISYCVRTVDDAQFYILELIFELLIPQFYTILVAFGLIFGHSEMLRNWLNLEVFLTQNRFQDGG